MTRLIYQTDSYQRAFEAIIVEVVPGENAVILDNTAFYPGGGGQPCDVGLLRSGDKEWKVIKVQMWGKEIIHVVEGELPSPGNQVKGEVDWERRYALMRTHTALHVLCGVVFRDYGALVTGGNMEPGAGRMDFEFESLRAELVKEVESAVNEEVAKGHEIRVQILPREEAFQIPDLIRTKINLLPEGIREVRTVEIVGLDLQADGGTHVSSTLEIGTVKIVDYKSKGAINKRIYIQID